MRILLGNEFGKGNGHVVPLRDIYQHIRRRVPNCAARFLVPQRSSALAVGIPEDVVFTPEVLTHPPPPNAAQDSTQPISFAQTLNFALLQEEGRLAARLRMWQEEISAFKPDVIVADYAPALIMAARGRVPVLCVGNGYTLPPPEAPRFPMYRVAEDRPLFDEAPILDAVNAALKQAGIRRLSFLPQANQATAYALATIAIFDPYWETRTQDYLGTIHPGGSPKPADKGEGGLAYVSTLWGSKAFVQGLVQSGLPFRAHIGRATQQQLGLPEDGCVQVQTNLFNFRDDFPGAKVIVHAGTLGVATAALYAGIPQVSVFIHDESWLTGRAASFAQIGAILPMHNLDSQELARTIREVADNDTMRGYARALSERYAAFRDADPIAIAANRAIAIARM